MCILLYYWANKMMMNVVNTDHERVYGKRPDDAAACGFFSLTATTSALLHASLATLSVHNKPARRHK